MTWFIAVAFGYWGRGATEEKALEECRKAGAKKGEKTILYRIFDSEGREAPYVDDHGYVCYFGIKTEVAVYERNKRYASS